MSKSNFNYLSRFGLTGILVLFVLFHPTCLFSQTETARELMDDADEYFKAEDYQEAVYTYLELAKKGKISANTQYKIGTCYLNISGEETKAIPYLEEAVKQLSLNYSERNPLEKKAPIQALYYLGNAYRIDNQLDKALECYKKVTNYPGWFDHLNQDIVENEIKICERAKIIQDTPLTVQWTNLGSVINSVGLETHPVISADEHVIAYLAHLKFYDAVYVSRKVGDSWLPPENINTQILSDGDFYPTALSKDGSELYLVKDDHSSCHLYVSTWAGNKWTQAKMLNNNINSSKKENYATITTDGTVLYFSSNRREGKGGFDIYKSTRTPGGDWGKAENLGKSVNSKADEISPSISADGKTLFFSSNGHFNMGGYDIFFVVQKSDGTWSEPYNIGFPINTTSDNIGYQAVGDGKSGYISRRGPDSIGKSDIYKVQILSGFPASSNPPSDKDSK